MKHLLFTLAIALLLGSSASAQTARTDGAEESEFGKGGYPFGGASHRVYLNTAFGSGFFSLRDVGKTRTGFLYGIALGIEMDQWLGIQAGYHYLSDHNLSIFSLGSRFAYAFDPFVYHASLNAGLYAPNEGSRNFGLAPGAGIDIILHKRVRIGLDYKHDFIFTDNRTNELDRIYVGLKFFF